MDHLTDTSDEEVQGPIEWSDIESDPEYGTDEELEDVRRFFDLPSDSEEDEEPLDVSKKKHLMICS